LAQAKIFLYNTSGGTRLDFPGVDAVTAASDNPAAGIGEITKAIDAAVKR
jgi:hypothetical protein